VKAGAAQLHDDIKALVALAVNSDGSVGSAFESLEAWAAMNDAVQEISYQLRGAKPSKQVESVSDDEEDEDDE
jgi:hypothetical protein